MAVAVVTAALVAAQVKLDHTWPGLVALGLIAIAAAVSVTRSKRTGRQKTLVVGAVAIVVAASVPLSMQVANTDTGSYSQVTRFKTAQGTDTVLVPDLAASPDLSKLAVTQSGSAGWIDANGTFTGVTDDRNHSEPSTYAIGFDRTGNFYYAVDVDHSSPIIGNHLEDIYRDRGRRDPEEPERVESARRVHLPALGLTHRTWCP
ncbi:MAG: hypothetical protein H6523_00265 [Mycolicibacterium sp.]|nr:hypothetical protein [Mycolicibacterium sp.]